jgi:hypothetical protein
MQINKAKEDTRLAKLQEYLPKLEKKNKIQISQIVYPTRAIMSKAWNIVNQIIKDKDLILYGH